MVGPYSVVIPAYNAAQFIGDAIRSVLGQSIPPQEVIVVDDGSTDATGDTVAAIGGPIKYVRQDNTGPGGATSRGIALVETEYFATLDADDLWVPGRIVRQFDRFAEAPGVAAVFGQIAEFRDNPDSADLSRAYDGWSRTTMLIRTSAARSVAPMVDHASKMGEFIDFIARLREQGHQLDMLPDVLAIRRLHPGSLSSRERGDLAASYMPTVREALLRRRNKIK